MPLLQHLTKIIAKPATDFRVFDHYFRRMFLSRAREGEIALLPKCLPSKMPGQEICAWCIHGSEWKKLPQSVQRTEIIVENLDLSCRGEWKPPPLQAAAVHVDRGFAPASAPCAG